MVDEGSTRVPVPLEDLLKEGEVLVLTKSWTEGLNFIWGSGTGTRWETHWLALAAGNEPWYGAELQLFEHAPKPNQT